MSYLGLRETLEANNTNQLSSLHRIREIIFNN